MWCLFFFFKQKTAYEITRRDWSSDVCSSDLLQGGIGGGALAERANTEVAVPELGDVAAPTEQRLHKAFVFGFLDGAVEPRAYAGEALEVLFDERLRFFQGDAQLSRQRQRALAVNRREVDRLGPPAHLAGDLLFGHPENHRRRLAMDVATALKRRDERRVFREMRKEPQLDLGVVSREQHPSWRRDEGAADSPAPLGADGDVLQVGVG